MAERSDSPKTEEATPRRRQEARKKGQVAYSSDLSNGAILLAGSLVFLYLGSNLGNRLKQILSSELLSLKMQDWGVAETVSLGEIALQQLAHCVLLFIGAFFALTLMIGFAQAGFYYSNETFKIDWEKLSPTSGWSRLLSFRSALRGGMTIGKGLFIIAVIWWLMVLSTDELSSASRGTLDQAVGVGWVLTMRFSIAISASLVLLGLADYAYQRWQHEQDLRMTRRELQDEHKDDEGDPQIRARIKKLQREISQRRMLADVPTSTVVLTNPTHIAVALRYDRHAMAAPIVVAKGSGGVAKRIARIARDNGIPVMERKPLARALFKSVNIGQEIPLALYKAVAEILAHLLKN